VVQACAAGGEGGGGAGGRVRAGVGGGGWGGRIGFRKERKRERGVSESFRRPRGEKGGGGTPPPYSETNSPKPRRAAASPQSGTSAPPWAPRLSKRNPPVSPSKTTTKRSALAACRCPPAGPHLPGRSSLFPRESTSWDPSSRRPSRRPRRRCPPGRGRGRAAWEFFF